MIVLEGCDAVGKTTLINNLSEFDLKDRDKNICKYIDFNYSLRERANYIYNYLYNKNFKVIFLVNNDRKELERRVSLRDNIDEYDKLSYLYNLLYLETYEYMRYYNLLNNKLYMLDVTGLNIEEEVSHVRKLIKEM